MRLGTGIVLLPLQHPVDMAEQVATLDQITGGRFIFGVGLGYEKEEFEAFGLEVSDRVGRFEESLTLIKRLWIEDEVHFQGEHFTLHARPSSWPLQKPHPPVWIAANGHGPVRRAARLGDVWFANPHAKFSTLAEQMDIYKAALAEYGTGQPEDVVVSREVFLAESRAEAMRVARPALHERFRVYAVQGQDEQLPPGDRFESAFEELAADRFVLGDPQECIDEVRRYEELGFNYFIIDYHWLDLDDATAFNTLRLFGEQVMPASVRRRRRAALSSQMSSDNGICYVCTVTYVIEIKSQLCLESPRYLRLRQACWILRSKCCARSAGLLPRSANQGRNAMMMWSIRRVGLVCVLAALALVAAACGDDESDETFKIGVMESLTGPGETYGTVSSQAKQLAVDEINAAGGVNGRMIELIVQDSKCSAQDAITAYNKLTDVDGVKIILGTSCSGAMLGAAPLAEADGVVLFSGLATNPDIAEAGDYIFRTAMSDAQLGIDTGNVLWADGIRTLATITEATDYAEGVRRSSVAQFEKLGGEVVAEERYPSDITDFRSQLTKLFSANPDALHIAAQAEFSGGTIIKQARELGFDGPIYTEVVPIGATALEVAGEAATGVKAITADLDPANQKAQEVLQSFRGTYDYVTLPWYLGSAYDDVYITAECLKQTGDDQDADGFRDCLYDITWSGAIGTNFSFDEKGEVVGLSNVVVEVLPVAERNEDNQGYKVLGGAPTP